MHYYKQCGEAAHFEAKDGKPTTLREARRLNLFPSVTTVLNELPKPGLDLWKRDNALRIYRENMLEIEADIDMENRRRQDMDKEPMTESEALKWVSGFVTKVSRQELDDTANAGSAIHDGLELLIKGEGWSANKPHGLPLEMVRAVHDVLDEHAPGYDWNAEQRVVSELGYAGQCDASAPAHGKQPPIILDWKTKDEVTSKTRAYDDQGLQLAAYAHALGFTGECRLVNVYVQREHDGDGPWPVKWFEHRPEQHGRYWDTFKAALQLWQVRKAYRPEWKEAA